ncbi:SLBB domain-containing protein [candidate division KSB1 bacterium]|nr:SLBB domain-containing protein [candidate division KSB1 bacterium]
MKFKKAIPVSVSCLLITTQILFAQIIELPLLADKLQSTQSSSESEAQTSVDGESQPQKFGWALFEDRPISMPEPGAYILPPDYLLGSGDKIGIYILGEKPAAFEVTINVEGKIFIPSIGVVPVAGMRLNEFKTMLDEKLSKLYDNYLVDIMLLLPKNIEVVVVGDVKKPGKHIVNSLNSVLDVVILAGGPLEQGSMRNIQLYRNDTLFTTVDFYQFLMKGESYHDVFLQSGDRIFIPLVEENIIITGEVKRPARFELKPNAHERLSDAIHLAGGFTEFAFLPQIEISRFLEDGSRTLVTVDYNLVIQSDSSEANIELHNGDQIYVYSKLEQLQQGGLAIYGEVRRPGKYEWQENMHVSDLIRQAGNLTRSAYILEAELARIDPLKPAKVQKINLQKLLANPQSSEDLVLEEDDNVFIRQIPRWLVGPTVHITGEIQFPGIYPIVKDSTKLSEVIKQAGGFTREALIRDAKIVRKGSQIVFDKEYERLREMRPEEMSDSEYQYYVMKRNMQDLNQILVDFYKLFFENDPKEDIILEDGDVINIPKAPVVIQVTGRVAKPGGVIHKPGAGLKYYLEKAGGTTWDADVRNTKVSKVTGEIIKSGKVDTYVPGDIIWVPRKPARNWWAIFRDSVFVVTQLATIYLIILNIEKTK